MLAQVSKRGLSLLVTQDHLNHEISNQTTEMPLSNSEESIPQSRSHSVVYRGVGSVSNEEALLDTLLKTRTESEMFPFCQLMEYPLVFVQQVQNLGS